MTATSPRTRPPDRPRPEPDDRHVIHVLLDPFVLRTEADAILGPGTVYPLPPAPREKVRPPRRAGDPSLN